jgi:hypothetical protein
MHRTQRNITHVLGRAVANDLAFRPVDSAGFAAIIIRRKYYEKFSCGRTYAAFFIWGKVAQPLLAVAFSPVSQAPDAYRSW